MKPWCVGDEEHKDCANENNCKVAISLLLGHSPLQGSLHVASWEKCMGSNFKFQNFRFQIAICNLSSAGPPFPQGRPSCCFLGKILVFKFLIFKILDFKLQVAGPLSSPERPSCCFLGKIYGFKFLIFKISK